MEFSPNLARRARLAAGLSQRHAAQAIGVSAQTVLNTEQGATDPRVSIVARMASAYGVPLQMLFDHATEPCTGSRCRGNESGDGARARTERAAPRPHGG